ncbi:MAG: hypothetical protein ACM3O8_03910 [Methylococcaceae bacterium]|nr:hypothetical protein [Prolixibacteraceae bacterium]
MKHLIIVFIVVFSLITKSYAQPISPYLFGQNHWIATGDEGGRVGYLNLLWPRVKDSGVKCVRIGGNAYNHHFPDRQRLSSMIDSIRHIGAEPLLQVPASFTALQAMELVEYYTRPGNRKVQFWAIGNEPMLNSPTTIDQVHEYLMRIAPAMKKVDPTIKIFIFDECEMREAAYRALCGGRLDMAGLKENGAWLIDGFNFHRYPNGRDFNRDDVVFTGPRNILNQSRLLKQIMEEADQKYGRTGDAKLMWGLTEVNVTYANPDREISGYGNTSFLGGQFMAEVFGIGMQLGAFSVNPWCISETDAVSTDFGYLGLPREFYPRSSYYHTQIMAQNMKGSFMNTSSNQQYVKTVGSAGSDQIVLLVMNEAQDKEFGYEIILNKNGQSKKPLVICADASLDKRIIGTIEKQSSLMFVFDSKGTLIRQITYGLNQNLKNLPPEVKEMK